MFVDEKKPVKAPVKEVRRPRAPDHHADHHADHKPRKPDHRPSRQSVDSRVYNSAGYRHQSGRAPATPVKPKDPMKLVGQKQSIKLLLVNKVCQLVPCLISVTIYDFCFSLCNTL